jgi:hypothetical protein
MLHHPVPENHLRHIGDMTISFALLEFLIQSLVGSLIYEHQRIGQIITAELSFKSIRALLISLYLERHGEDDDFVQLRAFMKSAAQLEEKRNQITHSVCAADKDAETITRTKTTAKEKHGIRFHFESVTAEDLENVATEIKNLGDKIERFHFSLLENGKVINSPIEKIWP